jgi:hypothetical protein
VKFTSSKWIVPFMAAPLIITTRAARPGWPAASSAGRSLSTLARFLRNDQDSECEENDE